LSGAILSEARSAADVSICSAHPLLITRKVISIKAVS
jgi:hypothetical protein